MATIKKPDIVFYLFFIIFTVIIFQGYLQHDLPTGTDAMGLPSEIQSDKNNNAFFSSWDTRSGLGSSDYPSPAYSFMFYVASSVLDLGSVFIAKSLMVGSFLLAGISMFLLVKRLTNHFYGAVAASLIFVLNQSFLSQIAEGHYYFVLSMALMPIIFCACYRMLNSEIDHWTYLTPFLFIVYGMIAPPNIIIMAFIFLFIFIVIYALFRRPLFSRTLLVLGILLLIFVFVALSVQLANDIPTYEKRYPIEDALRWSSPSYFDALRLEGVENSFLLGSSLDSWAYPMKLNGVASWLPLVVPLIAIVSPFFRKARPLTLPLALTCFVIAYLAKGPHGPFAEPFEWAFVNIPMFDSIRSFSRFTLLIGFGYSLLVGYLLSNLDALPPLKYSSLKISNYAKRRIAHITLVCFLAVSLVLPSTALFFGAVGAFNLPDQYKEPFDLVASDEDYFRVLNLPYDALYYDRGMRLYNYTDIFTLDPGIYSPLYTGKDEAFGLQSTSYWYFVGNTVQGNLYGYRTMPMLLGSTGSIKYVIGQAHASQEEKALFESLDGLTVSDHSSDVWVVLINEYWQERVHGYSSYFLATGGWNMLSTTLGAGLINSTSSGLVFIDQIHDPENLGYLANSSEVIFIDNGDMMELLVETNQWTSDQRQFLASYADVNTINSTNSWITDLMSVELGVSIHPAIITKGDSSLLVTFDREPGEYDLYLKVIKGPDSGLLNISIDQGDTQVINLNSPQMISEWIKIPYVNITSPNGCQITLQGDGTNSYRLEQAILATDTEMDEKGRYMHYIWDANAEKFVLVYRGTNLLDSGDGWEKSLGLNGWGIASMGGQSKNITITMPYTGEYFLDLYLIENGQQPIELSIDGNSAYLAGQGNDKNTYDLGELGAGEHNLSLSSGSLYAISIYSKEKEELTSGTPTVTFEKVSNSYYVVTVNSSRPMILELAESYNSWWEASTEGGVLSHIHLFSQVNGFIVPEGDHEVVIRFKGQSTYGCILCISFGIPVAICLMIWMVRKMGKRPLGGY